jgi:hypothetical protein
VVMSGAQAPRATERLRGANAIITKSNDAKARTGE